LIDLYSGTPGSGKSLEVARDIVFWLTTKKKNVVANFAVDTDQFFYSKFTKKKKETGTFTFVDNEFLTVEYLYAYAKKNHVRGKEGQTLLVVDEAQMIFSPTVMKIKMAEDKYFRVSWLKFMTLHRKLGFDIILVSQFDKLIDAQVRCVLENNVIHRKVNNFKIGWLLSIFKISIFVSVNYWYGINTKTEAHFFTYSKKYSRIYDSYKVFDTSQDSFSFDSDKKDKAKVTALEEPIEKKEVIA